MPPALRSQLCLPQRRHLEPWLGPFGSGLRGCTVRTEARHRLRPLLVSPLLPPRPRQPTRRGRGPRSCGWQRGIRLLGPARKPVPVPFGRTAPRRRTTAPNNCSRGQGDQGAQNPGVQNPGRRPASLSPSFPFCLQALCLPPATRSPASTPARCWLGLIICQEASDLLPVPLSRPVTESDRPLRRVGARSATAKEPPGEQNQVQLGKQQNKKPPRRLKK